MPIDSYKAVCYTSLIDSRHERKTADMTTKNTTYKIIGITDDSHICEHCGKSNLKRVVVLEHIDTGIITRMGTTCAFKALGVKTEAIEAEIDIRNRVKNLYEKGYNLLQIRDSLKNRNARVEGGKLYIDGIATPILERKR